jgi:protein-S-isoprenylcysteine O-methyltransferase Ste14
MIAEHSKSAPEKNSGRLCGEAAPLTPSRSKDSQNVMSCPPLVFLGALGAGWLLNWLMPIWSFSSESLREAGGLMGFAGTSLGLWGVYTLLRARTGVRPGQPVTALVTGGPFRYSRNPLYIGLITIYLGVILAWGVWWALATLIPALAVVQWRIVLREEQFLEARFGEEYRAYKARVKRWV